MSFAKLTLQYEGSSSQTSSQTAKPKTLLAALDVKKEEPLNLNAGGFAQEVINEIPTQRWTAMLSYMFGPLYIKSPLKHNV